MRFIPQAIDAVILVVPERLADPRGTFAELYRESSFAAAGITATFVQQNTSRSRARGTIRGLHMQGAPHAQGKLVRVARGAIWDVAVDVRRGSPTYARSVSVTLDEEEGHALWIPCGFLHGFCTLRPDSVVSYLLTAEYDPGSERGVRWDDPELTLPWPLAHDQAVVSDRDRANPLLAECRASLA